MSDILGALSSEVLPEPAKHTPYIEELRITAVGVTRRSHEESKKHRKMAKKSRRINRRK